jgi:hypothetical protein
MPSRKDDEFQKELKEVLAKPEQWDLERVDRAVQGARKSGKA